MFASIEQLTDGLWYERCTASSSQVGVQRRRGATDGVEPVLRVRRGAMNGRRVHIDLVLLGGDRAVEVSFHPAATVDLVRGHAQRRGSDANGWMAPLLRAITDDAARWGSWTPSGDRPSPLAVLGGVTHPLLGAAYDGGTVPAGEIPRWASPALAEPTITAGSVRLFGAPASSRSVVRALAALLVRPVLGWWQLALASAITVIGGPDEVAAVLTVDGAPAGQPVRLPTAEDRAALRAGLALLERARAKRLVLDALATEGERGGRRLAAALRTLVDAKDDVRWPPPVRLAELEGACLRATAVDPAPRRPTGPPPRAAAPTTTGSSSDRPPSWATPRRAPATAARRPPPTPAVGSSSAPGGATRSSAGGAFDHPPAVRALDRQVLGATGDLELVLPRTPQELQAWGRMLGNCLADFAPAVAEHRSVIVGVKERGALVAAVELRPSLDDVRQFLGARNRVPPPHVVHPVLRHLVPRLAVG